MAPAKSQQVDEVNYIAKGSKIEGLGTDADSLKRRQKGLVDNYLTVITNVDRKEVKVKHIKRDLFNEGGDLIKPSRYINITQIGSLIGKAQLDPYNITSSRMVSTLSFETYNGYRFNPFISAGIVAGIDLYEKGSLLPLGIGLRSNMLNKRITPTFFVSSGYATAGFFEQGANRQLEGGFFYQAGIGLKVNIVGSNAFTLSIGYKKQRSSLETKYLYQDYAGSRTKEEMKYERMALMLGFSF